MHCLAVIGVILIIGAFLGTVAYFLSALFGPRRLDCGCAANADRHTCFEGEVEAPEEFTDREFPDKPELELIAVVAKVPDPAPAPYEGKLYGLDRLGSPSVPDLDPA